MANPEDIPSPPLSILQIRDYSRRVLRPLAGRLACGEPDWAHVSIDRELWFPDGERQRIEFFAERDDDSDDLEFTLSTSVAVPFDDSWTSTAILQRMGAANVWFADHEDQEGIVIDGNHAEDRELTQAEGEGNTGFWARDASYTIKLPFSRRIVPTAVREVSFTFFDEYFDPLDGEIAMNPRHIPSDSLLDLDRLFQFGEAMLLQGDAEVDLIAMTVYDANFVLQILKSMGLVRRSCIPLA